MTSPWDFVVQVGPTPPSGAPVNLLKTTEANMALMNAYDWAVGKASTSMAANAAKVYIEAIKMNREYDSDPDKADHIQLLYILTNLTYWKGNEARKSKQVLRDYCDSIERANL